MQALVRHSMDPVAMLAGARRLDGRIQREEVRLVGDFIDGVFAGLRDRCGDLCPAQGFSRRRYRRCGLSLGERSVRHGSVATLIEVLMAG
jgi:hypothetical protein